MIRKRIISAVLGSWLGLAGLATSAPQQTLAPDRVSDITNTKHNFASGGSIDLPTGQKRDTRAVSQNETCVFCHTPHIANKTAGTPLWNRQLSSATYVPYASNSMQATPAPVQPGGSSKLCLSCHDGTIAIGAVNGANGKAQGVNISHTASTSDSPTGRTKLADTTSVNANGTKIDMIGAGADRINDGKGASTGFTSNLGTDLTNDHPISFTYNATLGSIAGDKELYAPGVLLGDLDNKAIVANRVSANQAGTSAQMARPALPLENGQMECGTCHDPHVRGTGADEHVNVKFLRLNRFQKAAPSGDGTFSIAKDVNCVACHKKSGWEHSAHAHPNVATQTYNNVAADLREFPRGTAVWEASCMNCHDNHTVQGARKLLREGTDSVSLPKSGGAAAQEETCYQCHTNLASTVLTSGSQPVADIKAAFNMIRHMPISTADQGAANEAHDVTNADLEESQAKLGKVSQGGNPANRHVECSDCHNPHRTTKNQLFNANAAIPDATGTHIHSSTTPHTNLASGALKGTIGVEPSNYSGSEFSTGKPSSFPVKKGNPATNASTDVASEHVTREYQVCMRCHSENSFDTPVALGTSSGGTASSTNGMIAYTDQAMEFQAPFGHDGDNTAPNTGAAAGFQTDNHRSWHPVMAATGRTAGASAYLTPFNQAGAVGTQTMYCSDCHGSDTGFGTVVPSAGDAWGPHGSNNDFILKGAWNNQTGSTPESGGVCSKCHNSDQYSNPAPGAILSSGFSCQTSACISAPGEGFMSGNLHVLHANKGDANRCMNCHVAVPHGFKNKGLLANLNDVGPEAGLAAGTTVAAPYTSSPYYNGAKLKVVGFKNSGQWVKADCVGCHTP